MLEPHAPTGRRARGRQIPSGRQAATARPTLIAREIRAAYTRLRRHNGPLDWWPGETAFEIAAGAILTQNTAWTNVEKAVAALKRARLLTVDGLRDAAPRRIEALIRPAGYFRQKTHKLKCFVRFLDERYAGSLHRMASAPTARLRGELLEVWGIGPETADSILLYACGHPVFVVDAYTQRVAVRHAWIETPATYIQLQDLFVRSLPKNTDLYNDYHAQLVWVGKHYCRTTARCEGCPLRDLLPGHPAM
jgi:endonuclease-3 related protein